MINLNESKTIIKKEFTEVLRDRITLVILVISISVIPFYMCSISLFSQSGNENTQICIDKALISEPLVQSFIEKYGDSCIIKIDSKESRNKAGTDNKKTMYDITIISNNKKIAIMYRSGSYKSYAACKEIYETFLKLYGHNFADKNNKNDSVIMTNEKGIYEKEETIITRIFLPIVLSMLTCQGTMELAANTIAGERERGTLELLLLNSNNKKSILFGKTSALIIVNLISIFLGILTLYCTIRYSNCIIEINYSVLLLCLILTSIIIALLSIIVSIKAQSYKSAQLMIGIITSLPSIIVAFLAYNSSEIILSVASYLPVVNILLEILLIFNGELIYKRLLYSVFSSLLIIVVLWKNTLYFVTKTDCWE